MNLKEPLSIKQQISKLKEHGMTVPDINNAEHFLSKINYYRFSGYAIEYRKSPHDSNYVTGANFDTVCRIYCFDEQFRNVLRQYIEKAEIYFRTKIAYNFSIAKCNQPPYNQHYHQSNYYRQDKFTNLLQHIQNEENYFQDAAFIKHHKSLYKDKMPLWVLVEIMTFSTLSKYYSCMYISDQELIAKDVGTSARILRNNLHALAILRNKCAHAVRLYNTKMSLPIVFNPQFLRRHPTLKNDTLFAYVVMLSKRLPDNASKAQFQNDMYNLFSEYKNDINITLMGFPANWHLFL